MIIIIRAKPVFLYNYIQVNWSQCRVSAAMDEILGAFFNLLRVWFHVIDICTTPEERKNIEHDVIKDLQRLVVDVRTPKEQVNRAMRRAANAMRQILEVKDNAPGEDGNPVRLYMIIVFLEQDDYSYMERDMTLALNQIQDDRAERAISQLMCQRERENGYWLRLAVASAVIAALGVGAVALLNEFHSTHKNLLSVVIVVSMQPSPLHNYAFAPICIETRGDSAKDLVRKIGARVREKTRQKCMGLLPL